MAVNKVGLTIESPDFSVDEIEAFLESLRPIAEYQGLGKVHVEILEEK